ncbi:MAG: DUF2207 domain-containing protein [Ruthenibacterium sp.]
MKRTLLCLMVALCLCFSFALPGFADDDGYRITSFAVDATLHENNTVTQTETITVEYLVPRHGMFRTLPTLVSVWRTVDGERVKMTYRTKISDMSVEGAPYETSNEDGIYTIRIGDPDEVVTGSVTYVIHYKYDIGDDRVADYDELNYSLNGPDCDTTIDNFSFQMHFDKPIPQESLAGVALYSGAYGAQDNAAGIEFTVTPDLISGHAPATLPSHNAVTVHARLPEGYFVGARSISMLPAWIAFLAMIALSLYTLLRIFITRHRRPVQTVEFYPPKGLTSADVGYIIDGTADDRDLISLVIWLADQGYLTIASCEDDEKAMQLTKVKNLPADMPEYVKVFFNALFLSGEVRRLDQVDSSFYTSFTKAKQALDSYQNEDARLLHNPASRVRAFLLPIGSALLWGVFAFFCACRVEFYPILPIIFAVAALCGCTLFTISADGRSDFSSVAARIWHAVLPLFMAVIALFCAAIPMGSSLFEPALFIFIGAVLCALCCLLAPRLVQDTPYRLEMAGKLLGLRNFIKQAELPRLKLLVDENPAYFYNILPYAYVFGLSDKWVTQFESLALAPPVWYTGSNAFGYIWFDQAMHHSLDSSLRSLQTESHNAGSGGSSGWGGSSGGFSGGGFGGGGTGSW